MSNTQEIGQGARGVAEGVSKQVNETMGKVREVGAKAADYARDRYDHLADQAHDAYAHSRDKVRDWEHSAERYVQARPLQALLIAAGLGAILALLWKRH